MNRTRKRGSAALLLLALGLAAASALVAHRGPAASAGANYFAAPADRADAIAPGIVHRAIQTGPSAGVDLIDVDLGTANDRIEIATSQLTSGLGGVTGAAYSPHDWLMRRSALAAINGGYFNYSAGNDREQVVGLLIRGGAVVQSAPPIAGTGGRFVAPGRYVRSAFGITAKGLPSIAWVATGVVRGKSAAFAFRSPTDVASGKRWPARDALGCGPTLIVNGRVAVSDYAERLVSRGMLPRTFVAYDTAAGRPQHFVMGVASSITYQALAAFIDQYYRTYHHNGATRAMCFDGGPSSQLSYRSAGQIVSPLQTGSAMPVAVLIVPGIAHLPARRGPLPP